MKTSRIAAALAAPALTAGLFISTLVVGAPAEAAPTGTSTAPATCITSAGMAMSGGGLNPLTRAAQVEAISPSAPMPSATSCLGR